MSQKKVEEIACNKTSDDESMKAKQKKITLGPVTENSSTANFFMAFCMRSNDVDFQTKSTLNPCVSFGRPVHHNRGRQTVKKTKVRENKTENKKSRYGDTKNEH